MCRKLSPLNAVGFIFLIAAILVCSLSFASPFWVVYPHAFKKWKVESPPDLQPEHMRGSIAVAWKGLLAYCYAGLSCTWFWENDFSIQKTLPDWYKATQISYVASLSSLGIALLVECIYSCCRCCQQPGRFPTVVASFAITGGLLTSLSLGLFGGFAYADGWFDKGASGGFVAELTWAFFVGVGGACAAILSSILFFLDGCCLHKAYRGYSNPKS